MTCNIGKSEQAIRIALGIILLAVGVFAGLPTWGTAAAFLVGVVALLTGGIRFCPAWWLFGINTCVAKSAQKT